MEKRLYKMHEKAKDDKLQRRLGTNGQVKPAKSEMTVEVTAPDYTQQVRCPFCLYQGVLQKFLVSTAKGISRGKAHCPSCDNGMLMKSLTTKMTIEQYAEWVFKYAADGFWHKCPFATWKKVLKEMGWAQRFWTRYKALKGEQYPEGTTEEQEEAWKQYEADMNEQ